MLEGKSIVCFANDWDSDPTSKHHVMRLISRHNKVLWINSIGMRRPSLTGSDFSRILRKIRGWTRGLTRVNDNLAHFTPIVLPFPASRLAGTVNRLLLRLAISYFRRRMGMGRVQLWSFLPNIVDHIDYLNEELLVYYCVDEWSKFSFMDGRTLRDQEIKLMRVADLVITTADHLQRDKITFNANTHLLTHGVEQGFFATSLDPATVAAQEVAGLQGPVIGFFGLIHEWIDLDLLAHIAKSRPDWQLVLIGKASVATEVLHRLPNVHLLGQRPYEDLPSFCRGFDLGLIPFKVNDLTVNVNPIKMREYLSAGLPVVATNLPEVAKYREYVSIGNDPEEIVELIARELAGDSSELQHKRSRAMISETWESKVEELSALVEEAVVRRSSRGDS